jgi:tetratricopeptide (TPR) repeat protein
MKRRRSRIPVKPRPKADVAASAAGSTALPLSRKRLWLFRLAALTLAPLLFCLALEAILRVAGCGYPVAFLLPDKISGHRVYVQNDRFGWRFFGPEMARRPWPLVVPEPKPPDTVRIFVFGESAAYGDPQPEFGLPRMLQALLSARYPGTRFEVFDAAMTAINSHAILPIARDCARRDGDIWVIYMGNNEVVGPFGAGTVFGGNGAPLSFVRASLALKSSRVGQTLDHLLSDFDKRTPAQKEWGGMEMFLRQQVRSDDPIMPSLYRNFERNLESILSVGHRHGVKIVLSTVACNLKDCAPFASLHRRSLAGSELEQWEKLYQAGMQHQQSGHWREAQAAFRDADRLDRNFAELHFRWGQCALAEGQQAEALEQFKRARDEDALRFRCDTRLNQILRQTAASWKSNGVVLADAEEALARYSPQGISGDEYFFEHVHLTFEGNYRLAMTMAQQMGNLLPEPVRRQAKGETWPASEECARRLAWTDWAQYQADTQILGRIQDAPFVSQLNHEAQVQRLRLELERLLPATRPDALRETEKRCRNALVAAPDDWVLHQTLARLQQQSGELSGATLSWRRVTELLPRQADNWERLGTELAEQKRFAEARTAFQEALRLDPDSLSALTGIAQLLAAEGQTADAIPVFEKVLKIKPYWGPAHLGLGKALEAAGRAAEAKPHFQRALQDRLNTPSGFQALGQFCFQKGWYSEAATNFSDALRLNPADAATHVNLGVTLGLLNRPVEACQQYAEAVRLDPNLAEARVRLGTALGSQGNDAAALEQFAAAVQLKPDMLEARLNLGIALFNQHRNPEALEQFTEVLRRNPGNSTALRYKQRLGAVP